MRSRRRLAALLLALLACHSDYTGPATTPTTTAVTFAGGSITAEIAATRSARETGLMNRTSLGANAGMLFVFQGDQIPQLVPFWMHNTSLPLSIAFLDSTRIVINVEDMAPNTDTYHYSARRYRFALEVRQGWFTQHGVAAGSATSFTLPPGTIIDP